jgi:hypothetical protein
VGFLVVRAEQDAQGLSDLRSARDAQVMQTPRIVKCLRPPPLISRRPTLSTFSLNARRTMSHTTEFKQVRSCRATVGRDDSTRA